MNWLVELFVIHIFRPSDLKENRTQKKTPFSSTVFNTLSHGALTCTLQICRFFSPSFGGGWLVHLAWKKVEAYI